jgi:hypothetical protein
MTFCSAGGLDLLTQTRYTTAEKATSYAVSSVPPRIDRIWALVWEVISRFTTAAPQRP